MNKIVFGKEAKDGLLKGIDTLYRAVSSTLGPRSHAVGIDYGYQKKILKDGVSVAKVILLEDPVENFGAGVVTEAAKKTVGSVGDATTCTIILAHALIMESQKLIEAGVPPMQLREELEKGVAEIIKEIDKCAKPVKTLEEKINVATISVAGDRLLGELIAKTVSKAGSQGVVTVEESKSPETYVDWQEGMQFDKGYASPYFVTNADTMEATAQDTFVLVTDKKINPNDLLELFREVFEKRTAPLVIIGPDMPDALRDFLIVNKMQGKIRTSYINAPFGGNPFLQDIAILTGARFISSEAGDKLESVKFEDLGKARRITSYATTTEIVGGGGKKELILERVKGLLTQIEDTDSDFEKDKLRERYAKLTQGVAVINVGGQTEIEMQERKERVHDAVWATKVAIEEGIVPGGEIIYLNVLSTAKSSILRNALKKPFRKLMENSGFDSGEMLQSIITQPQGMGIDVTDGKVKDMLGAGIIDPVAAPKAALKNALSVAIQILITDTVIVPIKEVK